MLRCKSCDCEAVKFSPSILEHDSHQMMTNRHMTQALCRYVIPRYGVATMENLAPITEDCIAKVVQIIRCFTSALCSLSLPHNAADN